MRAFLGLGVPESSRRVLSSIRAKLDATGVSGPTLRWTRPENLHVTVRFLGEISESMADALVSRLRAALHAFGPVTVRVDQAAWFPVHRPVVLAAGVASSERLMSLFELVEAEVVAAGLPAEARDPHPHVTIARIRQRNRQLPTTVIAPVRIEYDCRELVLYRSDLLPSGARYSRFGEISLGDAPLASGS